jgi:SAM-dependent methyltransferase
MLERVDGIYRELERINQRPAPFQFCTTGDLWTDEHISKQMLSFHLNGTLDVASRKTQFMDRSVEWIASEFRVGSGTRIADFGCGPGLYTTRLARLGADVTGIDFSGRSIDYARSVAERERLEIDYVQTDYLEFENDDRFDLVMMIMCDYCALSPVQRKTLLGRFNSVLRRGGRLLLDVYSLRAFEMKKETATYGPNLMDGFWSPNRYYGFHSSFKYDDEKVALDKYTIVERDRTRTFYNWLQHFEPERIEDEFAEAGFAINVFLSDVKGSPYDEAASEFAVIASMRR